MRGVNAVEAGAIRVDADEVTYNLHILVRYELERELLGGRLAVADLPEAWNARYTSYLGYTPKNDLEGVMQDIHWAWGEMGYFATYTLGNLYSAAIAETMRAEVDLDELMAARQLRADPAVAARAHPLAGQHPRGRRPDARGDRPPAGPRGLHDVPDGAVHGALRPVRVRRALAVAAALLVLGAAAGPAAGAERFRYSVSRIGPGLADRMTPTSWRPGCPVALADLRQVWVRHWDFNGHARSGVLIVHEDAAADVVKAFRRLFAAQFPVRRMRMVDAYRGSDYASIEADNTSAFNCRPVTGGGGWSEHAYGRAIDINPIENPYVSGGATSHRASLPYLDRSRVRPGMAVEGGALVRAFDAVGWGWGGRWSGIQDFQHFSMSGG